MNVTPASERDVLGTAFNQMVGRLGQLLAQTRSSADGVAETSTMLEGVTGEAAVTVQQVALAAGSSA